MILRMTQPGLLCRVHNSGSLYVHLLIMIEEEEGQIRLY